MDSGITRLLSGAMIRAKDELLTDDLSKKLGYSFALWLSERMGVSLNALILMLIDMGLTVLEGQKDQ